MKPHGGPLDAPREGAARTACEGTARDPPQICVSFQDECFVTGKFHLEKFHRENSTGKIPPEKFHQWKILPMENSAFFT